MKKRNLSNLTKEDLEGIYNWTIMNKKFKKASCPFDNHYCQKCYGIFPKLGFRRPCPCHQFNITYVKRIAKQILLEKNFIPK